MLSLSDLPTVNGGVPGYYGVVVNPAFRGAFPGVELRDGLSVRPVVGNRLRHLVAAIGRQIRGFWRCWPDGTPVVGGERLNAPESPPTLLPFVGPVLAQDRKPEGADEIEPDKPEARRLTDEEAKRIEKLGDVLMNEDSEADEVEVAFAEALAIFESAGLTPFDSDDERAAARAEIDEAIEDASAMDDVSDEIVVLVLRNSMTDLIAFHEQWQVESALDGPEFGDDPFAEMEYAELRERAKDAEVPEFWKLDTEELRAALRKAAG